MEVNRYEIRKGTARATVKATNFAAAAKRAAEFGFDDPDAIVLVEDAEAMREAAKRAYANMTDRFERDAERRALGGEN